MAEIKLTIRGVVFALFPDYEKTKEGSEEQVRQATERLGELYKKRPVVILVPEPDNPYDPKAIQAWCEGAPIGRVASEQTSDAYRLFDDEHEMVTARIVDVEVKRKGNIYVVADLPDKPCARKNELTEYETLWKKWTFSLPYFPQPDSWKACRVEEFRIKSLLSCFHEEDIEELLKCLELWTNNSLHDFSKEAMQTRADFIERLFSVGDKRLEAPAERLRRQFGAIGGGHRMTYRMEWWEELKESYRMELYWDKWRSGREDNLYKDLQTVDMHLRRIPDGLYANIGDLKLLFSALRYRDVPRGILWNIYTLLLLRERICRELDIPMKPLPVNAYGVESDEVEEEPARPKAKVVPKEKEASFHGIIQHDDPEKLVQRLHQLIDGRKGADVGSVLMKCVLDGYLMRKPKQKEFESEFTLLGRWTAIHNYMDDNNENALERANKIIIFP